MKQFSIHRSSLVSFDSLEPRRMRAVDSAFATQIDDGTVLVSGTSGKDSILVFNPRLTFSNGDDAGIDGTKFVVRVNGVDATFESFSVKTVQITTGTGNDNVLIDGVFALDFRTIPFYVNGGSGGDTITGSNGSDTLTGAGGNDHIDGRDGRDRLNGLDGSDTLIGNNGVDRLFGGAGNDSLDGGKSTDYLFGEGGNDTILGSDGSDSLDGGGGDDSLDADDGDDTVIGGSGNDVLVGGTGHDTLFGNAGDDTLQVRDLTFDIADGGSDTDKAFIDDFERAFIVAESRVG